MAPPPEYDKEPKAPDKNFISTCSDDSKILYAVVRDQPQTADNKDTTTTAPADSENNKDVETLDDGQLRALLDEAITYKCPKDREGKSSLFKELLHEVEQDEQACEAACGAARGAGGARGAGRRSARARRELQSNSLQDLVAAMAAEPAPRRARNAPPAQVSARAHHGGSLPSGVDTSFLLSEEPAPARGGYLATVRCVNPPPLAERRVSASDAHAPADLDLLARRSKPTFPMTYTARATLEIGSGSVCSGRAVTTTTASNQVRTTPVTAPRTPSRPHRDDPDCFDPPFETPPVTTYSVTQVTGQMKLMNSICSKKDEDKQDVDGGGIHEDVSYSKGAKNGVPRGHSELNRPMPTKTTAAINQRPGHKHDHMNQQWVKSVHNWYGSLDGLKSLANPFVVNRSPRSKTSEIAKPQDRTRSDRSSYKVTTATDGMGNNLKDNGNSTICNQLDVWLGEDNYIEQTDMRNKSEIMDNHLAKPKTVKATTVYDDNDKTDIILMKKYRERVGYGLIPPHSVPTSPTYFKKTTIADPNSSLFQSNQIFNNSTNKTKKTNNKKNFTVNQSQDKSEVCNKSINNEIKEATNESVKMDGDDLFETTVQEGEKFKPTPIYADSEAKGLQTSDIEAQNFSLPIDIECNDILSITYENSQLSRFDLKEHQINRESKLNSPSSFTSHIHKETIEERNKHIELHKQFDDFKLNTIKNNDIEFMDIKKKSELNDMVLPRPAYLTDQVNKQNSDLGCETKNISWEHEVELTEISSHKPNIDNSADFLQHLAVQRKFLKSLEYNDVDKRCDDSWFDSEENNRGIEIIPVSQIVGEETINDKLETNSTQESGITKLITVDESMNLEHKEKFIFAELPNNAYVFLTLPQSFFSLKDNNKVTTKEVENNNNITPYTPGQNNTMVKRSKKKYKHKKDPEQNVKNRNFDSKSTVKLLLFRNTCEKSLATSGLSFNSMTEVDSAIPFTCITTPEVVASCNTTSSSPQSAVAIDPKPLQLGSSYRAVSSLTGPWAPAADAAPPAALPAAPPAAALVPLDPAGPLQPRSLVSSSFNGLPLSRPTYGSSITTSTDDYKKSLDENGNAVQGFSSPLSGSSQQKKPRRKKSTKNETVIKSHQIDGYQGNKDLNEVLRFIESNAESARGHKLGRAKHKDDCDDKGKKRAAGRKDKDGKGKRASSLEERSRTTLEELTERPARPPRAPPAKPERRSWGDDAREPFYLREPDAAELTDFQTVTKKRRQRRRADDAAADPPRPPRAPSPRRAPSDRSNDSNDDLDSVHSLPATRAPPAPHASYADIARTRHNIPDLIESCNFYAEGEARAAPPADADYPVLAARRRKGGAPAARATPRKERAEPPEPDVVADRRPPVVLLDSAARPRDMDGVTFGFDVNEQLLGAGGGPGGGPGGGATRCDLVRGAEEGVAVHAGAAALRYVPPPPARLPALHHLHRIIDYVGAAWEDVVRCGGGKVRYFSE